MFEQYTERARRAVFYARHQASMSGTGQLEAEHLLLGILHEDRDLARRFFAGAEPARREILDRLPPIQPAIPTSAQMPISAVCEHAMNRAVSEANSLGDPHIGCEHLLLALAQEPGSPVAGVLRNHGLDAERLRVQLRERPQVREEKSQSPPGRVYQPVPRPGDLLELDGGIVQVEAVSVHSEGEYLRLELRLRRTP